MLRSRPHGWGVVHFAWSRSPITHFHVRHLREVLFVDYFGAIDCPPTVSFCCHCEKISPCMLSSHQRGACVRSLGALELHVLLEMRLQAAARHEFTGFDERSFTR